MFRPTAKLWIALAILCLGSVSLVSAQYAYLWQATLNATDGHYSAAVTLGSQIGATDGFDAGLDYSAPPLPPSPTAYIWSQISNPDPNYQRLNTDIRSATQDTVVFEINRDTEEDSLTVTWTFDEPAGFAPTSMVYGLHFGTLNPAVYTDMVGGLHQAILEPYQRMRIIYVKPPAEDHNPPVVGNRSPAEGNRYASCVGDSIQCDVTDISGVDPASITMTVAEVPIPLLSLSLAAISNGYRVTYHPTTAFTGGERVQVCVTARDLSPLHNTDSAQCWYFMTTCDTIRDLIAPTILNPSPAIGDTGVSPDSGTIRVWIEDRQTGVNISSIVMTFDGATITPELTYTGFGYLATYRYVNIAELSDHSFSIYGCDLAPVPNCTSVNTFTFRTGLHEGTCQAAFSKTVDVFNQNGVGAHNTLTFGRNIMGTDGFDVALDVNVPFLVPGFQSFFPLGTDTLDPHYHLTSDFRSCRVANNTWKIKAVGVTGNMSVQWSMADFIDPTLPVGSTFRIGISNNEFTTPPAESLFNMREVNHIDNVGPTQVIWITYGITLVCNPPTVRYQSPAAGESGVCIRDTVQFEVIDPENGVQPSTIRLTVAGQDVTDLSVITPVSGGYHVAYYPASYYTPNANIQVRVQAANNCIPPQQLDIAYSFQTGSNYCQTEWTENLQVHGVRISDSDTFTSQLFFGIAPGGTDGYDDGLDAIAPPPPPSGLDRVFRITASRPEYERLSTDIRGNTTADTLLQWKIVTGNIEADNFSPMWVSWDPALMPSNCELSIWASYGPTPGEPPVADNMHSTNSFTFEPDANIYVRYHLLAPVFATISGLLTVEDHADFAGTVVTLSGGLLTTPYVDTTNATGNFSFPTVASGCYNLVATRDSFQTLDTTVCIVNTSVVVNHEMMWNRYAYCGTTTPGGASIIVDGSLTTTSDAVTGSFSINLPFNGQRHPVIISMPRHNTVYDTVVVASGTGCTHNYTLTQSCFAFSGQATAGGVPLADVVITVLSNGLTATTDASGNFALDSCLENGTYTISAAKTCYQTLTEEVLVSGTSTTHTFAMSSAIQSLAVTINLEGVVPGSDLSGTTVTLGTNTQTTDINGLVRFDSLICGSTLTLTATHTNYATFTTDLNIAADFTTYSHTLAACRNVTLTVSDSTNQVVLNWSTPGPGVQTYVLSRDGVEMARLDSTIHSFTDTGVSFGTSYSYNMVVEYAECSSAPLTTPRTVTVVPPTSAASILVLDFDNGLTNFGGVELSAQVATWLGELMCDPTKVLALDQNENLDRYSQAWLNNFQLVYIITARNGARTDYFDDGTAVKLNIFAGITGKKLIWEGATAVSDVNSGTLPASLRNLLTRFNVSHVSNGDSAAGGNIEFLHVDSTWYHTYGIFDYEYHRLTDDMNDVIGRTGGASNIVTSTTTADGAPLVRAVKGTNTLFMSFYTAAVTSTFEPFHGGRRLIDPYLSGWGIQPAGCTGVEVVSRDVNVNTPTLYQNTPNPFAHVTTIRFALPSAGPAKVDVFSVTGEHVASVVDDNLQAGTYSVNWNSGELPGGIYLYRLTTASGSAVQAMTINK